MASWSGVAEQWHVGTGAASQPTPNATAGNLKPCAAASARHAPRRRERIIILWIWPGICLAIEVRGAEQIRCRKITRNTCRLSGTFRRRLTLFSWTTPKLWFTRGVAPDGPCSRLSHLPDKGPDGSLADLMALRVQHYKVVFAEQNAKGLRVGGHHLKQMRIPQDVRSALRIRSKRVRTASVRLVRRARPVHARSGDRYISGSRASRVPHRDKAASFTVDQIVETDAARLTSAGRACEGSRRPILRGHRPMNGRSDATMLRGFSLTMRSVWRGESSPRYRSDQSRTIGRERADRHATWPPVCPDGPRIRRRLGSWAAGTAILLTTTGFAMAESVSLPSRAGCNTTLDQHRPRSAGVSLLVEEVISGVWHERPAAGSRRCCPRRGRQPSAVFRR